MAFVCIFALYWASYTLWCYLCVAGYRPTDKTMKQNLNRFFSSKF